MEITQKSLYRLIKNAFTHDDLMDVCFECFPSLYDQLNPQGTFQAKARKLADHCIKYGHIRTLLGLVKARNPHQYQNFLDVDINESKVEEHGRGNGKVTLAVDLHEMAREDLIKLIEQNVVTFADMLHAPVVVIEIRAGSVILEIKTEDKAMEWLVHLYETDRLPQELKIQSIEELLDFPQQARFNSFGQALATYRKRSNDKAFGKYLTQQRLAELIDMETGFPSFAASTISNWELDKSYIRPRERYLLIAMVKILYQYDGLRSIKEADELLVAGGYTRLSIEEQEHIFGT